MISVRLQVGFRSGTLLRIRSFWSAIMYFLLRLEAQHWQEALLFNIIWSTVLNSVEWMVDMQNISSILSNEAH